jgi:predicted Zn-dependent peptidase
MFFAAFTPDVPAARVERALEEQIEEVRNMGISVREMEKVRNATLANRTFELYTAEHICQRIGYGECIEGDYRLWVERLEALKKLDTSPLVDVARRYWSEAHKARAPSFNQKNKSAPLCRRNYGQNKRMFGRGRGR